MTVLALSLSAAVLTAFALYRGYRPLDAVSIPVVAALIGFAAKAL